LIRSGTTAAAALAAGTVANVGAIAFAKASPALPAAPDPIYAAIEAREQADIRHGEACDRVAVFEDGCRYPYGGFLPSNKPPALVELEEQRDGACDEAAYATRTMFSTEPTTLAGAIALLRYINKCKEREDGCCLLRMSMHDDEKRYWDTDDQLIVTLMGALENMRAAAVSA
jgi:hypothetical protein